MNDESIPTLETESMSMTFDLNQAILLKWYTCVNMIGKHEYYMLSGTDALANKVIIAIRELYYVVRSAFEASYIDKDAELIAVKKAISSTNIVEVLPVWHILDSWLYQKGLTRFDNRIKYERHRAEVSNSMKGFN